MKTLIIALLSFLLAGGMVIVPSQAGPLSPTDPVFAKFIGGTIEEVDHSGLRVTMQTEQGKKESFPVADASVLMGLSKGDRVSIEMDEQGKVRMIVKTTPDKKSAPEPRN